MPEGRSAKGPQPLRSRAEIAAAAIRLADGDGLDAVTMRRVAARLGTGGASLYRYVASRDELLDLMVDAVIADLAVPPRTGHWRDDVVALASSLRELHRRHPWLADVRQGSARPGPNTVDLFEHGIAALSPAPGDARRKMEAIAMLLGVVTLFAQQEAHGAAVAFPALDEGRWPRLAALLGAAQVEAVPTPAEDLFARSVVGIVAGVLGPAGAEHGHRGPGTRLPDGAD